MLNDVGSKYWDLFELRIQETVDALRNNTLPPLRRLSLHITNKCKYGCNKKLVTFNKEVLKQI